MKLNEKTMQKALVVLGLSVLANMMWGSAAPSIKTGYALFHLASDDTVSQLLFAGLRFFFAGALTIVIFSLMGGKLLLPRRSALPKIGVLALFQTIIQYVFFYTGCANASGTNVAIGTSTGAFFTILVSCLIFRQERLTARKVIGCLLGFAGVVLINLSSDNGLSLDISLAGEGAIILSSVSFAFSGAFIKRYSQTEDPAMLCGWQFILGGAVMIIGSFALGGRLDISGAGLGGVLLIGYLALVSAVAYGITSVLMKYNPVSKVSVYNFLNPVFGVILSILILKESGKDFGLRGVIALALVCAGVLTVNFAGKKAESR